MTFAEARAATCDCAQGGNRIWHSLQRSGGPPFRSRCSLTCVNGVHHCSRVLQRHAAARAKPAQEGAGEAVEADWKCAAHGGTVTGTSRTLVPSSTVHLDHSSEAKGCMGAQLPKPLRPARKLLRPYVPPVQPVFTSHTSVPCRSSLSASMDAYFICSTGNEARKDTRGARQPVSYREGAIE